MDITKIKIKNYQEKRFDVIECSKNFDFLYKDSKVLFCSKDPSAKINHMLYTEEDFILTKSTKDN